MKFFFKFVLNLFLVVKVGEVKENGEEMCQVSQTLRLIYIHLSYLPTPPLRQDMTLGQFLSRFEFRVFLRLDQLPHQS